MHTVSDVVTMWHGRFMVKRGYDPTVRVPNVILKSVGFVGHALSEDSVDVQGDVCATGFFVSVPLPSEHLPHRAFYFVTAGHVAKKLSDEPIYFLVNKRGGGVTAISNPLDSQWWIHPTDKTADVAIMPIGFQDDADITAVALRDFATQDDFDSQHIAVGDETFITGLFTEATSENRVLPIVRHGNVAMLPKEQIQTKLGYADVHLIEARSIGGISGSPVFVRPSIEIGIEATDGPAIVDAAKSVKLLGIAHGHWDINENDINEAQFQHDEERGVNYGIAMVVPAVKIREILERTELVEMRQTIEDSVKAEKRKSAPGMDIATPRRREQTFTKEDFEAALKKVTRKTQPK